MSRRLLMLVVVEMYGDAWSGRVVTGVGRWLDRLSWRRGGGFFDTQAHPETSHMRLMHIYDALGIDPRTGNVPEPHALAMLSELEFRCLPMVGLRARELGQA